MQASDIANVSTTALVAIGALALVQIVLQVVALVQLSRTPAERVTLSGRRWLWVLIIVFGELIGAIVWFAAGRKPTGATDSGLAPEASARDSAIDTLYGGGDDTP